MNLALFDFDGTLTSKDSLIEFLKYSVGMKKYLFKMFIFSPIFVLYKLKFIRNDVAKQSLFSLFFKGMDEQSFKKIAKEYSKSKLKNILRDDRLALLKEFKDKGDRVIIVSASMECWLKPWCEENNLELLSTRLEFKDGKFTGKFETKNCFGIEKVNRVKEHLDIDKFDKIYAFGDSTGDDEMLAIADLPRKFTEKL